MKTDAVGNVLWERNYRPLQFNQSWTYDEAVVYSVKEVSNGFVATGYINHSGYTSNRDVFFLRVNPSGIQQIFRMFDGGGSLDDVGYDIIETIHSGQKKYMIVGGANMTLNSGLTQYPLTTIVPRKRGYMLVLVLDVNGNIQTPLSKLINEPLPYVTLYPGTDTLQYAIGRSIVETPDAYIVVGSHQKPQITWLGGPPITYRSRTYLAKIDRTASMNLLWTKTFQDPYGTADDGYSVELNNQGTTTNRGDDHYVILGSTMRTDSDPQGSYSSLDYYIITTDTNGTPVSSRNKVYYGRGDDIGLDIEIFDGDNNGVDDSYAITGHSTGLDADPDEDMFIQLTTLSGSTFMLKKIEGDQDDRGHSIATEGGTVYTMVGTAKSHGGYGDDDIYFIKTFEEPKCEERCTPRSSENFVPLVQPRADTVGHPIQRSYGLTLITPPVPERAICGDCSTPDPEFCSDPSAFTFQKQGSLHGGFIDFGQSCIQIQNGLVDDYVHAANYHWTSWIVDSSAIQKSSIWLTRTDATDGSTVWRRQYTHGDTTNIVQSTAVYDLIETFDTWFTMTGSVELQEETNPTRYDSNLFIFKVTPSGLVDATQGWAKSYGKASYTGNRHDCGRSLRETPYDAGYIVAGYSNSPFNGSTPSDYNVYVVKTDRDGNCAPATLDEWAYIYGGNYEDRGMSVRVCMTSGQPDGYIVAGYSNSFSDASDGTRDFDVYLLRLNSDGTVRWSQTYGSPLDDYGYDIAIDSDGGFLITGLTHYEISGTSFNNLLVLKTDLNGELLWSRTINRSQDDQGRSIYPTNDGGFAIAGCTITEDYGKQMYLVKFGECQDIQWSRAFPTPSSLDDYVADMEGNDWAEDLVQTNDGGFLLTGTSMSYYDKGNDGNPLTQTPIPPLPSHAYTTQEHVVKVDCTGDSICLSENLMDRMSCSEIGSREPATVAVEVTEDQDSPEISMRYNEMNSTGGYLICPEDERIDSTAPAPGSQLSDVGAVSGANVGTVAKGMLHPSPVHSGDMLTLVAESDMPSTWQLAVTDIGGSVIHSEVISGAPETVRISTSGWSSGTYLATARNGNNTLLMWKVVVID